MRVDNILIEEKVKEKILSKHKVKADEIVNVLKSSHLILRAKLNRYIAIGQYHRYITVIFEIKKSCTSIVTAYPSSSAQIRLFKKKKRV